MTATEIIAIRLAYQPTLDGLREHFAHVFIDPLVAKLLAIIARNERSEKFRRLRDPYHGIPEMLRGAHV